MYQEHITNQSKSPPTPYVMAASRSSLKGKFTFTDLPLETQKNIVRYVRDPQLNAQQDRYLLTLLLVSRHLFMLASAEIYRVLDFNFASSDVDNTSAPVSRTADALQTIVTSDQDYGQHIRTFRLGLSEENSPNSLAINTILWDPAADPSKVLNTLILLMVRKASMMESFLWDTPIELSGTVYQALHKISSLRHLRVRLDVPTSTVTTVRQIPTSTSLPIQHPSLSAYPAPPPNYTKVKRMLRKRGSGGYNYWANGRAFSGFTHLSSLALLGIPSHDCLGEIAECLRASSAGLKSLTLSISNELARKARKPSNPANISDDASDTDPDGEEDDETLGGTSLQPPSTSGQMVNEADIRKEKLDQENILAKIFDLQTVAAQGRKLEKSSLRPPAAAALKTSDDDDSSTFLDDLRSMLKMFLEPTSRDVDNTQRHRDAQALMKRLAEKYGNMGSKTTKKTTKDSSKQTTTGSSKFPTSSQPPGSNNQGLEPDYQVLGYDTWANLAGPPPIMQSSTNILPGPYITGSIPVSGKQKPVTYPDPYLSPYVSSFLPMTSPLHFGLDHLDKASSSEGPSKATHQYVEATPKQNKSKELDKVDNEMFDFDFWVESGPAEDSTNLARLPVFPDQETASQARDREDSMDIDMEHPDETTIEACSDEEMLAESEEREIIPRKRARFAAADSKSPVTLQASSSANGDKPRISSNPNNSAGKSADEEMRDYIRATHGLHLEELSLYLIPLKASILARALDLNVLKRITLLSVGPQDPFWILLRKIQNHSAQLSFESIHIDNVSISFLEFLKTFEGLKELFLLERKASPDVEPSSAKATVGITTIRKTALRKHIKTLQRVVIRNDNDETWDLDANSIRFLSNKGGGLTELGISLNMKHFHILMQKLPGFKCLIALQFFSIRTSDRSALLQVESLTFAADTMSHIPGLKLKYLALESHMAKIEHRYNLPERFLLNHDHHLKKKKRRQAVNGKGKAKADDTVTSSLDDSSGSDDPTEVADVVNLEIRLRFGDEFWEHADDVKMFMLEIRTGKLHASTTHRSSE